MSVNVTFLTTILLLLPMFYLLLAAPAFLFVRLDVLQVARLLRAMFFGYFVALIAVGAVAAALNALGGHLFPALIVGLITLFVVVWRYWIMRKMDAALADIQSGPQAAAPRMRQLHWMVMATNALQIAAVIGLIPRLVVSV